jgi:hypothetical protein
MCIIKQQIVQTGVDAEIKINLGQNVNFTGYQQGIDSFTGEASNAVINPVDDLETYRFRASKIVNLDFFFYSAATSSYYNSFAPAGFTPSDLFDNVDSIRNSFFIANFYDTYDSQTRIKYFTGYLTFINNSPISTLPNYLINPTGTGRQLFYWYIPNNYIETHTGTTATGYTVFTFYNAKAGRMQLFYNFNNSALTTNEKMMFKTVINLADKSYCFTDPTPLKAYELPSTSAYVDRYNNTVQSMENVQEQYPTGSSFNFLTGKYDVV